MKAAGSSSLVLALGQVGCFSHPGPGQSPWWHPAHTGWDKPAAEQAWLPSLRLPGGGRQGASENKHPKEKSLSLEGVTGLVCGRVTESCTGVFVVKSSSTSWGCQRVVLQLPTRSCWSGVLVGWDAGGMGAPSKSWASRLQGVPKTKRTSPWHIFPRKK